MTSPSFPSLRACLLAGIVGVVVAGVLVGAAVFQSSRTDMAPDMAFVPSMAERPFVMEDGSAIYVQAHEVTVADWNRCADAGTCDLRLRAPRGVTDTAFPATGLNWVDVNQYLTWTNTNSRHTFRLPTRAEWIAMAEAVLPEAPEPIFTDPNLTWASAYLTEGLGGRRLLPTGSYTTSAEGISDLDGNVWEWTQDCYSGAGDSRAVSANCPAFHVGGEHDAVIPYLVRDPARGGCAVGSPPAHLGMRLVTDDPLPAS